MRNRLSSAAFWNVRVGLVALALVGALLVAQPAAPAYAATFTVTTTADSGPGSLREAITSANATNDKDTIEFNIPGTGPHTITLASSLPMITKPLNLNGTTQPGYSGIPLIHIDGAGVASDCLWFDSGSDNSDITAVAIGNCIGAGVWLRSSSDHVVTRSYFGTFDGVTPAPNGIGVYLLAATNSTIGVANFNRGNLISGNTIAGIRITAESSGNAVLGNRIGTDAAGSAALGNLIGVDVLNTPDNVIGGNTSDHRNVISGNSMSGIRLFNPLATGNVIEGNYIGTDRTGTVAVPNVQGIVIEQAPANTIGGGGAARRNVISGNVEEGIFIVGSGAFTGEANDNVIQGNTIGADATGMLPVPNRIGIYLRFAQRTVVGAAVPGSGNLITNNTQTGLILFTSPGAQVVGNRIESNEFGLTLFGTSFDQHVNQMNCYEGNTISGIQTDLPVVAEDNWWGDPSGPSGFGPGTGDAVDYNVDFDPWVTTGCGITLGQRVTNGGFDFDSDGDLLPDGWEADNLKLGPLADGLDCIIVFSSPCSFRFVADGAKKQLAQSSLAGGGAGEEITLSLVTREENLSKGGTYSAHVTIFYTGGGKKTITLKLPAGTHDWTARTASVLTTTRPYDRIEVKIEVKKASGTVWIDDVSVVVVP